MSHQQDHPAGSPEHPAAVRWGLVACLAVGMLLVLALVAGVAHLRSREKMAGLGGTWRDAPTSRHTFQFRPNGDLEAWYQTLPMGALGRWQRDGQQITIRTDRNWDFEGELDGEEIRGKQTLRDQDGATVTTVDGVWRRE